MTIENVTPIQLTLERGGFAIVPDQYFDGIKRKLTSMGVPVEHLYRQSEKSLMEALNINKHD